ncbi:MAG: hypothetical protein A3J83_00970 [Elusimicrobia bacterium RIFOXYA2_FULL_40_6]|nr:MAG: hypothetical protein A3J83_00970 [Elusimicrobia bacterium RIFOXYA2_FULL_40_6]
MLKKSFLFIFVLAIAISSSIYLDKNFKYPFDVVNFSQPQNQPPVDQYALFDLSGVVFGVRKMAADIAWIQVLQYYGGDEEDAKHKHDEECKEHDHERCTDGVTYGSGEYSDLKNLTRRVMLLDPYFHYACVYGGACLAWNLNRPDEGIALLDEGIRNVPDYWQFTIYKMAIIYKKLDKYQDMVGKLEEALKHPDCPIMVKAMLANLHKKNGNYVRALQIWVGIYDLGQTDYRARSEQEIAVLRTMTGL